MKKFHKEIIAALVWAWQHSGLIGTIRLAIQAAHVTTTSRKTSEGTRQGIEEDIIH